MSAAERRRVFRRSRLVLAHPELQSARAGERDKLRSSLGSVIAQSTSADDTFLAEVEAGAILAAMEAGIDRWVRSGARGSRVEVMDRAFTHLASLTVRAARGRPRKS